MAARINELTQKVIEGKRALVDVRSQMSAAAERFSVLVRKPDKTSTEEREKDALDSQLSVLSQRRNALDREVNDRETEMFTERQRIDDMRSRPGRSLFSGTPDAVTDDDDRPATSSLPPLPSRTVAVLSKLYPRAEFEPGAPRASRDENWRGTLAAALGGQPLHPSVLAATATEGVPSDGGFFLTPDVAEVIFRRAAEVSVWLRIGARLESMTSDEKIIHALDDDDETNDAEAGLTAGWTAEAAESDAQIMKLRRVKLKANKLLVLAAASNELAEDAPTYVTELEAALARAIGKRFDRAVLTSTGAGAPLGLLNSAATITIPKETNQQAATFNWDNAVKMWARLAPGSHENSWWLMSPTVLPQALSMSLAIGAGGTQPRGVFEPGGPTGYMLLGRPVVVTSRVKALGTKGDVILVDPSQVVVGIRRGITIERSRDAFFSSDRLAIRGKFRGDARPLWETPRTLVEGNVTVSPIVVLDNRS